MKTLVVAFAALLLTSCAAERSVQVSVVQAELIKVDTLYRNSEYVQLLTWQSPERTQFVSYAGIREYYPVGAKMAVFVPR